jgi:hypothetical protein
MRLRAGKWEIGSAVVSLCSLSALFTNQGSSAMLIERLPASVQSAQWTTTMVRVWAATTSVTMVVTAVGVPVLLTSHAYRSFFSSTSPILLAVFAAGACSLLELFGAAFIAARRAGRSLTIQTLVSAAKILFVFHSRPPVQVRWPWWKHGLRA